MDMPGIVQFFETLSPARVRELGAIYDEQAEFRDPFNDVRGLAAIEAVYRHMFETLVQPRFVVLSTFSGGAGHVVLWDFEFRLRGSAQTVRRIRGTSHLKLAADGRIAAHHDYWDAAQLYAQLPVLGGFMRWLRRRAAAPT